MKRRIFLKRLVQFVAAPFVATVVVSDDLTVEKIHVAKEVLDVQVVRPKCLYISNADYDSFVESVYIHWKTEYVEKPTWPRQDGAGRWLTSCWAELQDGGEWQAGDYHDASGEEFEGVKENCLNAMWRRSKWLDDPDRVEGIHV